MIENEKENYREILGVERSDQDQRCILIIMTSIYGSGVYLLYLHHFTYKRSCNKSLWRKCIVDSFFYLSTFRQIARVCTKQVSNLTQLFRIKYANTIVSASFE